MSDYKIIINKRNIIVAIALFCMFFFRFLPTPAGMTKDGLHVFGIFCGALLLWLFISIDWPSLLCILALAFVPGLKVNSILANSLGNNTFAFLMFSFMCTHALSQTTFIRRIAVAFISSRMAKKGPWQFTTLFFAAIVFIGCFISPTVLFVVSLPILEEIYALFHLKKGDKFAAMLMMGLVCCSGISSGMTPIGHVYGPLAIGFYETAVGKTVDYAAYMGFAVPVGIVSVMLMLLIFRFVLRPETGHIQKINTDELKTKEKVTGKEISILVIFLLVVALWILPSFIKPFVPAAASYITDKTSAFPPLLGIVLLSVITSDGKSLIDFNESVKKGISWPALIMCAGTLALGAAMTNESIGLTSWLSDCIAPFTATLAPILMVVLFTTWSAIQTNLSSNIVTITVVANIAIPILLSANGTVSTPAVISIIGMMGGYAFAAPPAMPSVVIAGGSGWVSPIRMMKYGFTVMIISILVTVVLGYPLAVALMGY